MNRDEPPSSELSVGPASWKTHLEMSFLKMSFVMGSRHTRICVRLAIPIHLGFEHGRLVESELHPKRHLFKRHWTPACECLLGSFQCHGRTNLKDTFARDMVPRANDPRAQRHATKIFGWDYYTEQISLFPWVTTLWTIRRSRITIRSLVPKLSYLEIPGPLTMHHARCLYFYPESSNDVDSM